MQTSSLADASSSKQFCGPDFRRVERIPVVVPAIVEVGNRAANVRVVDLTRNGALLEIAVPLRPGASLTLRCGRIDADCTIVWSRNGRTGVKFCQQLTDTEVDQQVSRNDAISNWRRQFLWS